MFQKQNIFIYILTTLITAVILESCSSDDKGKNIENTQSKDINYKLLFNLDEKYINSVEDAKKVIKRKNFDLKSERFIEEQKYYLITAIKKDYSVHKDDWELVTVKFYFNRDKEFIRTEVLREKYDK